MKEDTKPDLQPCQAKKSSWNHAGPTLNIRMIVRKFPSIMVATIVGAFIWTPSLSLCADEEEINADDLEAILADDHAREELGVNVFTAPSIARLLKDIESLRPIPYSKIRRAAPTRVSSDRAQIALTMGALIAQGFALVDSENIGDLEDLARSLLRHARGLSVLEEVIPRASSLVELGLAGDWSGLREELTAAQTDAEKAMLALRDEEIAHLISTGGWLRGLEIVSETILQNYSPERAEMLRKVELLDYFYDRLASLHPDSQKAPTVRVALPLVAKIRGVLAKDESTPLTIEDLTVVRDASREIMDSLLGPRRVRNP